MRRWARDISAHNSFAEPAISPWCQARDEQRSEASYEGSLSVSSSSGGFTRHAGPRSGLLSALSLRPFPLPRSAPPPRALIPI